MPGEDKDSRRGNEQIGTTLTGLIPIGFFYFLVFATGVWASRKESQDTSSEGLMLAGRKMPVFVGIFTMTATWVGGGYIIGTAAAAYGQGLVWAQAPWGYAMSLVLGGLFFARKMRAYGFTTLLDLFERKYGERVASGLFIPALVGEIFWSAAILSALGLTFGTILGYDIKTSILVASAIAILYTMVGGMWSVAYTDVVQLIFLFLGLVIALPFAIMHAGGFQAIVVAYQTKFAGSGFNLFPPLAAWGGGARWGNQAWFWLDMAFLLMLGGIPWQVYFQRVLSSRDDKTAVRLSLFAGLGCIFMAIPAILVGVAGTAIDWSQLGQGTTPKPDAILPYVLIHLTPPFVAAVGLGAVAAAVMSSVDSSILSGASMFTWNVYRPLFRRQASEREIRLTIRIAVLVLGAAATWMAMTVQSVYALWVLCADLVYVVLFPQLVMALFFKKSNYIGAIAGAVVGLLLRLGGGEALFGVPAFIPYPMTDANGVTSFPFRTFSMLTGLLTIWLVSLGTQKFAPALSLDRPREPLSTESP